MRGRATDCSPARTPLCEIKGLRRYEERRRLVKRQARHRRLARCPRMARKGAAGRHDAAVGAAHRCSSPHGRGGRRQSIGGRPLSRRYSLAREKCPQPMNPRCADSGDGCGALSTRCRAVDQLALGLRVAAPEQEHEALALAVERVDAGIGETFPALALMRAGDGRARRSAPR